MVFFIYICDIKFKQMKKIILLFMFVTFLQAQEHTEKLKGEIEFNGHIIKKDIWFKANLDGIEIYDKDKNKYKKRNCNEKDCKIIHLELNNNILINNWQYFNYKNTIITPN